MHNTYTGIERIVGIRYMLKHLGLKLSMGEAWRYWQAMPENHQKFVIRGYDDGLDNLPLGVYMKHFAADHYDPPLASVQ